MTKETDTIEEYKALEVVNIRLVKEPSIISEKPISNANDAVNLIVFCKCKFLKFADKNGEFCISVLEKVAGCPAGLLDAS